MANPDDEQTSARSEQGRRRVAPVVRADLVDLVQQQDNRRSDDRADAPMHDSFGTQSSLSRAQAALLAAAPVYQRIAAELRHDIDAGQLPPGSALPSENDLIARHHVSRNTIRNAVNVLRTEGLVISERGIPTRVRERAHTQTALSFDITRTRTGHRTWDQDWTTHHAPSRYRVRADAPPATYGHLFPGNPGEPLFVTDRQLERDGVRLTHRLCIPFAAAAQVAAVEADPFPTPGDLYSTYAQAGQKLTWHDTTRAEIPTPDDTATLAAPTGSPVLVHTRLTRNTNGDVLAIEETRLPAALLSITSGPTITTATTSRTKAART